MKIARSSTLRAAGSAVLVSAALASTVASAQPAPTGSTALAEALFQQARDLFKQQRYVEACPRFAESQRQEPKLGTLLNLAVCDEKLGKTATAWAEYTSAATIAHRENSKDREEFARDRVAALEKTLAHVYLQTATPAAGLRVTLDDQPLDPAALNLPLPIDPGKHRIAATAPGKTPWSTTIDVPPSPVERSVPIPPLEPASEPPPPPVATSPAPPSPATVVLTPAPVAPAGSLGPAKAAAQSDPPILAYAGFSVGATGLLVGAITGGVTLANAGRIRAACQDDLCPTKEQDALRSANTLANVANASFVVGALGAGVGLVGLLRAKPRAPTPRAARTLTPILGPFVMGLRGTF